MTSRIALFPRIALALAACAIVAPPAIRAAPAQAGTADARPPIDAGGRLRWPSDYREWVYLTTGMDMSYATTGTPDHHMFDSVFVDPQSYRAFKETGTWPEKTMLVLETRGARTKGSINQRGFFQDADVMGVEVHMKDSARFAGGWAFFSFDGHDPAAEIDHAGACYACHRAHAAVDTTFVQFYPTLLPVAKAASTLSAAYLDASRKAP